MRFKTPFYHCFPRKFTSKTRKKRLMALAFQHLVIPNPKVLAQTQRFTCAFLAIGDAEKQEQAANEEPHGSRPIW